MSAPIIDDTVPYIQYTASGAQTTFPYPFAIFEDADVKVYKRGASATPSDAGQLLQLNVDYTVTGAGSDSGGNIILTTGATAGDIITVIRNLALERRTVFQPGTLTDDALNEEFNNILAMVQDINMTLAKIIPGYNYSAIFNPNNKKLPTLPANHMWRMNSLATGIETVELPDSDPGASILRSDLASHSVGVGASLVGLESGQTVQEFVSSIEDNVIFGLDTSVSANTVTVTFAPPITAYNEDALYLVRIANTNSGATVANFNGVGDLPVRYMNGDALDANSLLQHKVAVISYVANNGSPYLQLLNPNVSGNYTKLASFVYSLAESGSATLPGGLIIKWGKFIFAATGTATASQVFTFPVAFPNACFSCVAQHKNGPNGSWGVLITSANTFIPAGVTIDLDTADAGEHIDDDVDLSYIAIGR